MPARFGAGDFGPCHVRTAAVAARRFHAGRLARWRGRRLGRVVGGLLPVVGGRRCGRRGRGLRDASALVAQGGLQIRRHGAALGGRRRAGRQFRPLHDRLRRGRPGDRLRHGRRFDAAGLRLPDDGAGRTAHDPAFHQHVVRAADHDEMLDIVAAQQNQTAPSVQIGAVDHGQPGAVAPLAPEQTALRTAGEAPDQPRHKHNENDDQNQRDDDLRRSSAIHPEQGIQPVPHTGPLHTHARTAESRAPANSN
ncbi:hypothetical protein [Prosthecodimorpha hirschii]|uniref:hypothetical protein n=1 Tax=Prosthecodimorpha hirschii TaxID=665126 RepID=UPI001FEE932C|nr:hypothetical protein [Prosthecomicrobium hirschii]